MRDRVLDNAHLESGEILLDVGAGDGLIAFGALERLGPSGRVLFADVSVPLLDHCRARATELQVADRCAFVLAAAEDLSPVADSSVDVVTTRSVLIYVADKAAAFGEFFRVLRPGGRLSIFEPINRYFERSRRWLLGLDATGIEDLVSKVTGLYERLQPTDTDPMLSFGERDLVDLAEAAGFGEIHVDLSVDVRPNRMTSWRSLMDTPPNPLVPSLAEAVTEVLSAEEARKFESHLRSQIESGRGIERAAVAYLQARLSG